MNNPLFTAFSTFHALQFWQAIAAAVFVTISGAIIKCKGDGPRCWRDLAIVFCFSWPIFYGVFVLFWLCEPK